MWVGGAAILLVFGASESTPGVVEGSAMVLRGADGRPYMTIEQDAGGQAVLALRDRQGVARVELSLLDQATPRVVLRDGSGTDRAKLLLMPEGSPMLLLKDRAGRTRTEALHVEGAPGFVVFDDQGRPGWRAPDDAVQDAPAP
jgi:hypothetical protein